MISPKMPSTWLAALRMCSRRPRRSKAAVQGTRSKRPFKFAAPSMKARLIRREMKAVGAAASAAQRSAGLDDRNRAGARERPKGRRGFFVNLSYVHLAEASLRVYAQLLRY